MDALRIRLLLLLPCLVFFLDGKATASKQRDLIPICTNETSNVITLIVCRIRTARDSGEECNLLYREEGDFVHECDSRFTLKTWNDTVFLHLTSLTAADNGNFTCECSRLDGTYILSLNITVNENAKDNGEDEDEGHFSEMTLPSALTATVLIIIILISIIVGFVHRRCCHREQLESSSHNPNEDLDEIEPYSTFIQKENGLYSTTSLDNHQINFDNTNMIT
ncbi:uncharacterized protein LOC119792288 isoform X2 [Cyprinodon tularosa]|uniref:uncharacterized protein LOC119792288 isoform X2 n=1 Tax=Cyprinodon tularosa TaxID=77115 RepID=UPI0018E23760|nr:uncharacterized protein LOC119792288 isoform X2 [Cyprinodon tularosa]